MCGVKRSGILGTAVRIITNGFFWLCVCCAVASSATDKGGTRPSVSVITTQN